MAGGGEKTILRSKIFDIALETLYNENAAQNERMTYDLFGSIKPKIFLSPKMKRMDMC
ncbi:MAG: hypothetical protein ACLFTZ_03680 [Acholeplasmataceae bacterium]